MALLPITVLGAPILREETVPVEVVTDELRQLAADMFETMKVADGVGLAAPQVGRRERLCVVEVDEVRLTLFNPEIVAREGRIKWEEGCLSIPHVYGWVDRAERVTVHAMNEHGAPIEVTADGLLGVCLQHEIDHLHGKLFIDHLSFLKRRSVLATWDKEKERYPKLVRIFGPGGTEPEPTTEHHTEQRI
jgi:peptide deformylase